MASPESILPDPGELRGELLHYVEDVAVFFEREGLPRMVGRVIGWLLVCDPPAQTAGQLAEALQASKGSISTATRTLVATGVIERVARPGERRDYFRIRAGAWADLLYERLSMLTAFNRLTARGLRLLDGTSAARRERLESIHDLYVWLDAEFPALWERWEQHRRHHRRREDEGSDRP